MLIEDKETGVQVVFRLYANFIKSIKERESKVYVPLPCVATSTSKSTFHNSGILKILTPFQKLVYLIFCYLIQHVLIRVYLNVHKHNCVLLTERIFDQNIFLCL